MLILYDTSHNKICGLTNYEELKIEREINIEDTLSFNYPLSDEKHNFIQAECYIRTTDNEYIVKEVNTVDDDWDEYVCKINIEGIKGKEVSHFETTEQSCQDTVNLALAGTGWSIGSCDVAKNRTVKKNNCTAYDVLTEIQTTFGCEMSFDAINKKVYIYQSMGSDKGVYFAEQLNLKQLQAQRNSYDYITKLIPVGKDGLDITSVNGGNNYIENHQYSDKVIAAYWEDNRYTVAQDLYDDAYARLDFLSRPLRAYKVTVIDLANISDKYNILDYGLGDVITLIAKSKNIKEKQRIIKITIYPEEPERNTCEIANKITSVDQLQVRFEDTSDTVDDVTTSDGGLDGSKVDSIDAATQITNLDSEVARITNLTVINANIANLQADKADINDLNAVTARVGTLEVTTAHITNGVIDNATIDIANVNNLSATYAKITDLDAATGRITNLESTTASINTLLAGNLSATNMQAGFITADSGLIANGAISSAQIISLDVSKINAGTISTTKFTVQSDSGYLSMSDNTIQIKDANRVRVQIGKDASNDYNMYIWDASGNLMFDATGLKADGIKDKIIRDDMVSDTANINAAKLDIDSLFSEMNGSTDTLKSSRIYLDTQAQTLDVAFNSLSNTVTSQGNTVNSQGTEISAIQGQISSKIWNTDITSAVNGIQIGGTNLIVKSLIRQSVGNSVLWNTADSKFSIIDLGNDSYKLQCVTTNTDGCGIVFEATIKGSTTYTLTVRDIAFSASNARGVYAKYLDASNNVINGSADYYNSSYSDGSFSSNGTVSKQFVTPSNAVKVLFYLGMGGSSAVGDSVFVYNVKLEIGNKPTDWSPAPEDTQGQIDTINTNYSTLTQTVSGISTDVASLQTTTSDLGSRMSTAESNITQNANQIATKVTQADIDNSINGMQIGGTNLLLDSDLRNGLTSWSGSNGSAMVKATTSPGNTNFPVGVISCIENTIASGQTGGYATQAQVLLLNTQYTVSFWVYIPNGVSGAAYLTAWYNNNGWHFISSAIITERGQWVRKSLTFITDATYPNTIIGVGITAGSAGDTSYCTLGKLEIGNKATDWSPAPEDVQAQLDTAYSEITQNADNITSKVDKNGVISAINQSAESVRIQASKIDLSGYVTVSSLSSAGATTINGSNITTGSISAARIVGGGSDGSLKIYSSQGGLGCTIGGSDQYPIVTTAIQSDDFITTGGESTLEDTGLITPEVICDRYRGESSPEVMSLGTGPCHIDTSGEYLRLYSSSTTGTDSGIRTYAGETDFIANNSAVAYVTSAGAIHGSSKSAITQTIDYGTVITYSDESPDHVFNDRGRGQLDANGQCIVSLDPKWAETVNTSKSDYIVLLTGIGTSNVYVDSLQPDYFIVKGDPNKEFFWTVTAERYGYEGLRWNDADLDI